MIKILSEFLKAFKKIKLEMLFSILILYFLYNEVSMKVFMYFCYLQLLTIVNILFKKEIREFANSASKMIIIIQKNISDLKKIYDELIISIKRNVH